jgi:MFS family permease
VARTLQGLATAIVVTVGYALVFDKVGPEQLGQAMGYTSMSLSMVCSPLLMAFIQSANHLTQFSKGWFVGPVVGGIIYEHAGYLTVFAPPLALVGVEIILRLLLIENEKRATSTSKGRVRAQAEGDRLSNATSPLLPPDEAITRRNRNTFLTLLSSKRFVVGMLGFCILNGLMIAFDGVLPVFLKERYGFDSQQVSLTFLALTVPMLLSPLFGALTDRMKSTKWPAVTGVVLSIPGLLLLRLTGNDADGDFALLIVLLVEIGLAFAIALPALAAEVMHAVDEMERKQPGIFGPNGACAQAYGLTNAGLGVGCILGPMGAGFVRVRWGWNTSVTCMAFASALTAVFLLPITGGSLWQRDKSSGQSSQAQAVEDGTL